MAVEIPDLARRFDRASYDLAKSLVKLDEVQKHPEMSLGSVIAEIKRHRANVVAFVEQIGALEVLQEKDVDSTGQEDVEASERHEKRPEFVDGKS